MWASVDESERRCLQERIPEGTFAGHSNLNAPDPARFIGVHRKRVLGDKAKIALDRQTKPSAYAQDLGKADIAKFGTSKTEVTEPEGDISIVGIKFGQEPGCSGIWGEKLDDRDEIRLGATRFGLGQA